MKRIVFNHPVTGDLVQIEPFVGGRLATRVTIGSGNDAVNIDSGFDVTTGEDGKKILVLRPVPVSMILRGWPIPDAVAEWAETEGEWVDRIARKHVVVRLTDQPEVIAGRIADAWFKGVTDPSRPVPTHLTRNDALMLKIAFDDTPYEIVDETTVPQDRTFRAAWKIGRGTVDHDIDKCKEIAHGMRRAAREAEFKPFDDAIAKRIPNTNEIEVEEQRQAIRDKYAVIQNQIDAAINVRQLQEKIPKNDNA